jgi:hypothetical protein
MGVLVGAASLAKLSGASLGPIVVLVLLLRSTLREDWQTRIHHILVVGLTAFAVAGWWFIRNQVLYGDPSGQWLFKENFAHMIRPSSMTWGIFQQEVIGQLERTFWGTFGFGHIVVPSNVRTVVWACAGSMLLGWALWIWRWLCGARPTRRTVLAWLALASALVLLVLFMIRFSYFALAAGQGRYLLPASLTIGAVLVVGLNGYSNWRFQMVTSIAFAAVMLIYAVIIPVHYVWPKYRVPESVADAELARAAPLGVSFEGGIDLVAVWTSDAIVIPGQGLDVTTY